MKKTEVQSETMWAKIYQNIPKVYFILQIVVGVWAAFWVLFNHQPKTGDDVEHLHSAWLIFQGKVPYVDFFQHHNPLLWYLFAPLVGYFAYELVIFDIVRIISTLVMFLTLYLAGLTIKRFVVSGSWYVILLVIASAFPSYVVFSGQDFRPDNYMIFSFILGQFWFLGYLKEKKTWQLVASFASFFISFLFMQKIIFELAVFGGIALYNLYMERISWQDFLKALIFPMVVSLIGIGVLINYGMLERYWLANYIFNLYIPDVYGGMVEITKPEFYVLCAIGFCGFIYFMIRGNEAARLLSLMWLLEAVQRFFYFSLDRHYYYLLLIQTAMLAGGFIWVVIKKYNWSAYLFMALSVWGMLVFRTYCLTNKLAPNYHRYVTPRYVLETTNRCDSVLNGYGLTYGIFSKDITYYWNLNGQLDVIGSQINLAPLPDLNAEVEKYLPKIIYGGPYWNEKLRQRNIDVFVHWISPDIREKYYEQSIFIDVFILKPEYQQQRRCRYNSASDTWEYYYKE